MFPIQDSLSFFLELIFAISMQEAEHLQGNNVTHSDFLLNTLIIWRWIFCKVQTYRVGIET